MQSKINKCYDSVAELFDARRKDKYSINDLIEHPAFLKLLPNVKNKVVLDIGCGTGVMIKELLKRGAKKVVGTDASKKMIEFSSNNLKNEITKKKVELYLDDISKTKLKQKFDLITCSLVFDNVVNFESAAKNISKLLKKKGIFIFSTPTRFGSVFKFKRNSKGEKIPIGYESNYFDTKIVESKWDGHKMYFISRPLGIYINEFAKLNFMLEEYSEPKPIKGALKIIPKIEYLYKIPFCVIIKFRKM
jgi:ubiquinone/menaquinone biosynthesis C-methylase UbiE